MNEAFAESRHCQLVGRQGDELAPRRMAHDLQRARVCEEGVAILLPGARVGGRKNTTGSAIRTRYPAASSIRRAVFLVKNRT